jgi:AcrR family transcriptional regulator
MGEDRRFTRDERRQQIIDTTLNLVAESGVTGTTLSRIASAVGVTTPALYAHFANRKDILLASMEVLIERRTEMHRQARHGNALERLREIGLAHSELVASDDKSVIALFEFIAASPHEGLRETLGDRHLLLVEEIAEIVREGQSDGIILREVDPQQVGWMIVSRAWTENVAYLMGVTDHWNQQRSNQMLDLIITSISTKAEPPAPNLGGC